MARHNREGNGEDQLGREYEVSYQPDWFYQMKVTRDLPSGRQSTKTLFRNPEPPAGGARARRCARGWSRDGDGAGVRDHAWRTRAGWCGG